MDIRDVVDFQKEHFPYSEKSHGIFKGFFVPPHNGTYAFYIRNDDVGVLHMSDDQSVNSLVSMFIF